MILRVIPIDSIEDEDYWDDNEEEEADELIPIDITSLNISSSISNIRSINNDYLNESNDLESVTSALYLMQV